MDMISSKTWNWKYKISLDSNPDTFIFLLTGKYMAFLRIGQHSMEDYTLAQTILNILNILRQKSSRTCHVAGHVVFPVNDALQEKTPEARTNFRLVLDRIMSFYNPGALASWVPYCRQQSMTQDKFIISSRQLAGHRNARAMRIDCGAAGEMDKCVKTFVQSHSVTACFANIEWEMFTEDNHKNLPTFLGPRQGIIVDLKTHQQFAIYCHDSRERMVVFYDNSYCVMCRYPQEFDLRTLWSGLDMLASALMGIFYDRKLLAINCYTIGDKEMRNIANECLLWNETTNPCMVSARRDSGEITLTKESWDDYEQRNEILIQSRNAVN